MLFNSFEFILLFLPIVTLVYYLLNRKKLTIASKAWLVLSSLFFYSWWNISYLPLILLSILVNYGIGLALGRNYPATKRKAIVTVGILFNLGMLGYYKYTDFLISNANALLRTDIALLNLGLPLAISFYTFQQIAFIVDCYRKETRERDLLNYFLFITFFPQLIVGPIVYHKDMMSQFMALRSKLVSYKNQAMGMFVFSIGLFKKVVLADTFATWATEGFDKLESLSFIEAWITSLSYTFQIYFDFSGYMDMAMGAALLFNIKLPINFNSPYKSLNIQQTWHSWHVTLSQFLNRYVFAPLNRFLLDRVFSPLGLKSKVTLRISIGLLVLFLLSGLWHGAGWNFVLFGLLHGVSMIIYRCWKLTRIRMNKFLAWFINFNLINFSFVLFRASSMEDVVKVLKGMLGLSGIVLPAKLAELLPELTRIQAFTFAEGALNDATGAVQYILIGFILVLCFKNSNQLLDKFKPAWYTFVFTCILFLYALLNLTKVNEFVYFNF
ncbi:MBOAT family O-acyltransferase [Cohnella boryungensis]|uniref:MBOAT family protein n=1 Tax=Cohnella boryungensis TaxID=768479 RepID=A0ABV8S7A4_9BACL